MLLLPSAVQGLVQFENILSCIMLSHCQIERKGELIQASKTAAATMLRMRIPLPGRCFCASWPGCCGHELERASSCGGCGGGSNRVTSCPAGGTQRRRWRRRRRAAWAPCLASREARWPCRPPRMWRQSHSGSSGPSPRPQVPRPASRQQRCWQSRCCRHRSVICSGATCRSDKNGTCVTHQRQP